MEYAGILKRGNSFSTDIELYDPITGLASDLAVGANQMFAILRDSQNNKLCKLLITAATGTGKFVLSYSGSTEAWPIGKVFCDVRYISSGKKNRSVTFFAEVERGPTEEADCV